MNSEVKAVKIRYSIMSSQTYRLKKASRMQALKKARTQKTLSSSREYLVISNSVIGENRIESRNRINKILLEKIDK